MNQTLCRFVVRSTVSRAILGTVVDIEGGVCVTPYSLHCDLHGAHILHHSVVSWLKVYQLLIWIDLSLFNYKNSQLYEELVL